MTGSFFVGALFAVEDLFPGSLVRQAKEKLADVLFDEWVLTEIFAHNFSLDVVRVPVPTSDRVGEGGGLTEFGSETLLITHDGRMFALSSENTLEPLDIVPPGNGFDEFLQLSARPEFAGRDFGVHNFRFNDVLHVQTNLERAIIVSYSEYHADNQCVTNTLAKLPLSLSVQSANDIKASAADWSILFRSAPCLTMAEPPFEPWGLWQAGGRIDFKAPDKIVLSSGDYQRDGILASEIVPQDLTKQYGKVIAIDLASGQGEIISSGHRNPQGLTVDRDGKIWSVEHGPRGGDELNLSKAGADFGWPQETYGTLYNKSPVANTLSFGRHETFDAPIFSWVPSIAASSIDQVQNFSPSWDNDLLVGSLRQNTLYRLRIRDDRVVFTEPIRIDGARIRYVLSHADGKIILWEANNNQLTVLTARADTHSDHTLEYLMGAMDFDESERAQLKSTIGLCQQCHSFAANDNELAPNLADVYGRAIAKTSYANYSSALKARSGKWSQNALEGYILDPQAFASGTSMPDMNLSEEDVALLIEFLKTLRETPTWELLD